MNQVTLPVAVIIIITQKWNSKSKIKVLEKDIKENAATNLGKTWLGVVLQAGETHQAPSASAGDGKSETQVAAVGGNPCYIPLPFTGWGDMAVKAWGWVASFLQLPEGNMFLGVLLETSEVNC